MPSERAAGRKRVLWTSLLVAVCAVALCVPLYNRVEPRIGGVPFFFWFLFGWTIVSAIVTALAYRAGT